jgi:hypothetical protein
MNEERKFDKPVDQWTDEQREIERTYIDFDSKTGKLTLDRKKTIEKVPTLYTRMGDLQGVSCADGQHTWYMEDRHKHIAACHKCTKHRFLRAVYETIVDGHIIDRDTKEIID